jgi:hypothetical protein
MLPQSDLHFLQEKIQDLKNALFFPQNTSLLRITTAIVSVLKVDELGQMWFFVARPQQAITEFDREFPVRLEFFRKGRDFFLHVLGKAFIVTDPEEINGLVHDDIRELAGSHLVLIRVQMSKADYFETPAPSANAHWWKDLSAQVYGWLFNSRKGYRPYYLNDTPTPIPVLS